MIKNLIFDFGGVIIRSEQSGAISRFKEIGVADAAKRLDKYQQFGIFGDLEEGRISADDFLRELSKLAGHEVSFEESTYAWRGYCAGLPQRNLDALVRLREKGYRVLLLSNTNPFMMSWARSNDFDGQGHGIDHYFDHVYTSYELCMAKPHADIFQHVLEAEHAKPQECIFVDDSERNVATARQLGIHTICPKNNEDWIGPLDALMKELNK